jgi:hypothetical protein
MIQVHVLRWLAVVDVGIDLALILVHVDLQSLAAGRVLRHDSLADWGDVSPVADSRVWREGVVVLEDAYA